MSTEKYSVQKETGRKVIINADDYGMNVPVVDAIVDLAKLRRISSTTIMASQEAFDYGCSRLREIPWIGIGVHLNFSSGKSVSPAHTIPSLIDRVTGSFRSEADIIGHIDQIDPVDIFREFSAQIEKCRAAGIAPTHLDNHQDAIYFRQDLVQVVFDLALHYGLPIRFPFDDRFASGDDSLARTTKLATDFVRSLGERLRARLERDAIQQVFPVA